MGRLFFWRKSLRRFAKAREGVAAVEFGLIALPFFLLTIGVAEVSLMGYAQASLNFAVSDTAREIRTGRAQEAGVTELEIHRELCDRTGALFFVSCDNLFLDVQRFASFADIDPNPVPIVNGELQSDLFGYNPGLASDIVVVRAYYRWNVITPLFERFFANANGGERILMSTMMFRNEPF